MRRFWIIVSLVLSVFFCKTSYAGGNTQRFCTEKDLQGTYLMVDFHETVPSEETANNKQFPFQYLAFYPDYTYNSMGANSAYTTPDALNILLKSRVLIGDKKFVVTKEGQLLLYKAGKISYNYRCLANSVDGNGYKKNDIILNGYGNAKSNELYKLYRRWY